jgi:hypothetical protein
VLAGNTVDIPVHAPVNACGNSVDAAALLNPGMGNSCGNGTEESSVSELPPQPQPPSTDHNVPPTPQVSGPSALVTDAVRPQLAETGFDGRQVGAAGAAGAGLLLGGAVLYRRRALTAHCQAVPGRHAARPR